MTNIDSQFSGFARAKYNALRAGHIQRVQLMLLAAFGSALGIVAVAAAMLGKLF